MPIVTEIDPEIAALLERERIRQNTTIQLIPSQSTVTEAILAAQGSLLTNLAVEGYPGRRYFPGNEQADAVERLAIERAKTLFGAEHANVQPHSGVNANTAVYLAALEPGDAVLGMALSHGGHLSHGYRLSLSGRFYRFTPFHVDRVTEQIDCGAVADLARRTKTKMIVVGGSAYSRTLDFARFREICDQVGALLLAPLTRPWVGPRAATSSAEPPTPRPSTVLCSPASRAALGPTPSLPRPSPSRWP